MQNISKRVLAIREALGLSQTEFSRRLGFSRDYVSKLEGGKSTNPSHRFLSQLEVLEKGAEYTTTRSTPSMPPHHALPPDRSNVVREDAVSIYGGGPTETEYAEAVMLLRKIFDRHPKMFRAAVGTLRGLYETLTK